jgi:hypothetical protein
MPGDDDDDDDDDDDHTKQHQASCADVQTRSLVVSTMRPANFSMYGTTR